MKSSKSKILSILLIGITTSAFGGIFGEDDRVDYFEIKDQKIKELTKSTPALVRRNSMKKLANGDFKMIGPKFTGNRFNFCTDAKFSDQPHNANCSAALIDHNKILTAGHCIDKVSTGGDYSSGPSDYYVVFDYKRTSKNTNTYIIPKENVFKVKPKFPYYNFDFSKHDIDLTILELERSVDVDLRKTLKVNTNYSYRTGNELFIVGYPLGLPLKYAEGGEITKNMQKKKNTFRTDLDIFSVNSGSPVFDKESNEIIGVLVRGTGANYTDYGRSCNDWFKASYGDDFHEANTLEMLKVHVKN